MDDAPLYLAHASAVGGVAALRLAWSRKQRSRALNGAGWALLVLGAALGGAAAGAWGIAMVSLTGMGAAFVALAVAGARSPAGPARAPARRANALPEQGEPPRIGRRAGTFALTIVAGFAVSVGLALAIRGLADLLGLREADANVIALYSAPLTWSVLVFALLMQPRRRTQIATLLVCCALVAPVLLIGARQ